MQFTDRLVKNLKPKKTPYDLREKSGQGFAIRVMPSGYKTWTFFYHFGGKKQRLTLGSYPAVSLAKAHEIHRNAVRCLSNGKNPIIEQQKVKIETRTMDSVNDLIEEYLEKWARLRKRSWKKDERMLVRNVTPFIGKQKVNQVERRDIVNLLDRILERGSPIMANRTLAVVRRMFNFAVERDIVSATPCYGFKAPAKENKRDRSLTDDEIRSFWCSLDHANMLELSKLVLKLQLVTAQRKGEIISAEWDEIDLAKGWWNIPAHKSKNGNLHRVPFSTLALQLLQEIRRLSSGSKWLFPSPNGNNHMLPEAINKAVSRSKEKFKDVKHFTPHDLRRTAASHMTAIGIPRLVVSKILNHTENSVTAIYDRHSYDKEKKQAMEEWGLKLENILKSSEHQQK